MKITSYINKLFIVICFLTLGVWSCTSDRSPYFETLLKSETGIFRGASISSSLEKVKSLENDDFLIDEMPDYLYYDYPLDMGNSYTVAYDFSENQLYEIEMAIYFDVIEDADKVFAQFTKHFTKKYKKGKSEANNYTVWKTKSEKNNHNVEIALVNDSKEYGYISVLISDLDY